MAVCVRVDALMYVYVCMYVVCAYCVVCSDGVCGVLCGYVVVWYVVCGN